MDDTTKCLLNFKKQVTTLQTQQNLPWDEDIPICQWDYITCNSDGQVTQIQISTVALNGRLDQVDLQALQELNTLKLMQCGLTGTLSQTLLSIPNLRNLNLKGNILQGPLPQGDSIVPLISIDLSYNKFQGHIPETYYKLQNLQLLDLSHNQLNGIIPKSLTLLTDLKALKLNHNYLCGKLPDLLTQSQQLDLLDVRHNNLCVDKTTQNQQENQKNETSNEQYKDRIIVAFGNKDLSQCSAKESNCEVAEQNIEQYNFQDGKELLRPTNQEERITLQTDDNLDSNNGNSVSDLIRSSKIYRSILQRTSDVLEKAAIGQNKLTNDNNNIIEFRFLLEEKNQDSSVPTEEVAVSPLSNDVQPLFSLNAPVYGQKDQHTEQDSKSIMGELATVIGTVMDTVVAQGQTLGILLEETAQAIAPTESMSKIKLSSIKDKLQENIDSEIDRHGSYGEVVEVSTYIVDTENAKSPMAPVPQQPYETLGASGDEIDNEPITVTEIVEKSEINSQNELPGGYGSHEVVIVKKGEAAADELGKEVSMFQGVANAVKNYLQSEVSGALPALRYAYGDAAGKDDSTDEQLGQANRSRKMQENQPQGSKSIDELWVIQPTVKDPPTDYDPVNFPTVLKKEAGSDDPETDKEDDPLSIVPEVMKKVKQKNDMLQPEQHIPPVPTYQQPGQLFPQSYAPVYQQGNVLSLDEAAAPQPGQRSGVKTETILLFGLLSGILVTITIIAMLASVLKRKRNSSGGDDGRGHNPDSPMGRKTSTVNSPRVVHTGKGYQADNCRVSDDSAVGRDQYDNDFEYAYGPAMEGNKEAESDEEPTMYDTVDLSAVNSGYDQKTMNKTSFFKDLDKTIGKALR